MIIAHEFSRLFQIGELGHDSQRFEIRAEPQECTAVAHRLQLLGLDRLEAHGSVESAGRGAVRVRGTLSAAVTQECVVTLEPVSSVVEAGFERLFVRAGEPGPLVTVDPDAPDREPLLTDYLDLGEIVVEELALALDPYPRAPGADDFLRQYGQTPGPEADDTASPFVRLATVLPTD